MKNDGYTTEEYLKACKPYFEHWEDIIRKDLQGPCNGVEQVTILIMGKVGHETFAGMHGRQVRIVVAGERKPVLEAVSAVASSNGYNTFIIDQLAKNLLAAVDVLREIGGDEAVEKCYAKVKEVDEAIARSREEDASRN